MSSANILPVFDQPIKPRRALLSVSDKSGIVDLANSFAKHNIELVSTGGTYKTLKDAGLKVIEVSDVTGFPECLDGRVKTLHPVVHAGILARTSYEADIKTLNELGIAPFEIVVVNLYPFSQTVAQPDTDLAKAIEFIDIGGPTMVRAAAKNNSHVAILTSPSQYEAFLEELNNSSTISYQTRLNLARDAFQHTASYDAHIADYLSEATHQSPPNQLNLSLPLAQSLRYGENPHQKAGVYGNQADLIDCFHGKQLSYNNFLDTDAAISIILELDPTTPACAIVKHTNPCGVAVGSNLTEAWSRAFATDTVSPFGGIIAVNKTLDLEAAEQMDGIFTEIIIAPDFTPEAIRLLTKKANRRLIRYSEQLREINTASVRSIFGGVLVQDTDKGSVSADQLKTVTKRKPTELEFRDMLFAWKLVKHVKSNAIVFVKDGQTLGIGNGQTSRVDSSELAVRKAAKAGLSLQGSAFASDAFFPFADGVEAAAEAGATAIIQPGGSMRDEEVIEAANRLDLAMVFTGMRHFRH